MYRSPEAPNYLSQQVIDRLTFIVGDNNYSVLNFSDDTTKTLAYTLKRYEEKLPPSFVRISKSVIVNPLFVKSLSYSENKGDYVVMHLGDEFAISKRRYTTVRIALQKEFNRRML